MAARRQAAAPFGEPRPDRGRLEHRDRWLCFPGSRVRVSHDRIYKGCSLRNDLNFAREWGAAITTALVALLELGAYSKRNFVDIGEPGLKIANRLAAVFLPKRRIAARTFASVSRNRPVDRNV
jgi:hypothetical protein